MKYRIRYKLTEKGVEEIKVPLKEARKEIDELLKRDKEMLKILEKL